MNADSRPAVAVITPAPVAIVSTPFDHKIWFAGLFLQLSQRLGAIALLSTIGTWAMMYMIKDFHVALAIAAGTAEAGLTFALIARLLTSTNPIARREANGIAIFNLVLFVLAIHLMLFARLDVIRDAASQFFTPSTPLPQTGMHG